MSDELKRARERKSCREMPLMAAAADAVAAGKATEDDWNVLRAFAERDGLWAVIEALWRGANRRAGR